MNDVDFTQYMRKPNQSSGNLITEPQEEVDFSQFMRKSTEKSQRSPTEKALRTAGQFGLGLLQGTPAGIAYDVSTVPLASKEAMNIAYRESLGEDLDQLMLQKASGHWSPEDQKMYDSIVSQLQDPRKSMEFAQTANIGIRDIAEKATGQDLHPEGILEKSANWLGFLKNPKNAYDMLKKGINPKELIKTLLPGQKVARALGAGTALEMAEEGNLGPTGQIAAMITGDLLGAGGAGLLKAASQPKKTAAQLINLATRSNSKSKVTKQLIEDFKKSGIQMDAGTMTNSDLVKMTQARLSQSGLTGEPLENLRKSISESIVKEYENIIGDIGELTFENNYQAAESIKDALKVPESNIKVPKLNESGRSLEGRIQVVENPPFQENLLNRISPEEFPSSRQAGRQLKQTAEEIRDGFKQEFNGRYENLNQTLERLPAGHQNDLVKELDSFVEKHQGSLLLGESAAENKVLQSAIRLRQELSGAQVTLRQLNQTKQTLADIADWEFGGSNFKSAYKKLVGDIDGAIQRTMGEMSPELLQEYQALNHDYSIFKEAFENKNVQKLFNRKNRNYNALYNEFATNPDKMASIEIILGNSEEGQRLVNQLKRDYARDITDKPNLNERNVRDLQQVLGPEYADDLERYIYERGRAKQHKKPVPAPQERLGIDIELPRGEGRPIPKGKIKESAQHARKKFSEFLEGKSPEQIMKEMDTVKGIKRMRNILGLTPEGKELFQKLARHKIADLIDNKMLDNVTGQIKQGTFSGLMKDRKSKEIVHELLGDKQFERLRRLQKNVGHLHKSADKFFNASKSGVTILDMGAIGSAATGIMLGNPWLAIPAIGKIGGSYVLSSLLSDPVFLKELEKAILTDNTIKFMQILEKMEPHAKIIISEATHEDEETNDLRIPLSSMEL